MFWKRFSVAVHEAEGGDLESGRTASSSTIELKKTRYVYTFFSQKRIAIAGLGFMGILLELG